MKIRSILEMKEKKLKDKDGNLCRLTGETIEYLDKRGKNPNLLKQIDE